MYNRIGAADLVDIRQNSLRRSEHLNLADDRSLEKAKKEIEMTITEAVKKVLMQNSKPLTVAEIHQAIVAGSLFEFKSNSAAAIVRSQIRRHCEGVRSANVSEKKHFRLVGTDRYELMEN